MILIIFNITGSSSPDSFFPSFWPCDHPSLDSILNPLFSIGILLERIIRLIYKLQNYENNSYVSNDAISVFSLLSELPTSLRRCAARSLFVLCWIKYSEEMLVIKRKLQAVKNSMLLTLIGKAITFLNHFQFLLVSKDRLWGNDRCRTRSSATSTIVQQQTRFTVITGSVAVVNMK